MTKSETMVRVYALALMGSAVAALSACEMTGAGPGVPSDEQADPASAEDRRLLAQSAPGLEQHPYDGAEVSTNERYSLTRGAAYKAEWIAKPVKGKAAITLFSLFDNSSPWTEIGFETFGGNAGTSTDLYQTQYVTEQNGVKRYHDVKHGSPNIFDGNLHRFGITFTPSSSTTSARIVYEIDGVTIRTVVGGDANALDNTVKAYAAVWKVDFGWGSWGTWGSYPLEPIVEGEVSKITVHAQSGSGWSVFRDYPFVDANSLSPFTLSNWTFPAFDGYYRPENVRVINNRLNLRLALADSTKPSVPQNLRASPASTGGIALSWTGSTDNVRIGGYEIRRNGTPVARTEATTYTNTGLAANTSYCYTVAAYDVRGNVSDGSAQACATASGTSSGALPSPWNSQDIGAVAAAGAASVSGSTFTVKGSGADIWNAADEFRYLYQPLNGDGQIVARVVSLTNTNEWAKAGVMVRESLAAGSRQALMAITPGRGASFQWRTSTGGTTASATVAGKVAPQWVRVTRQGSQLRGYVSADKVTWMQVGAAQTISMTSGVNVGLAVTSHRDGTLATGVFDGVLVTTATSSP